MPFNNYQKLVDALRSREVRPPFEEIRELLLAQEPKRKAALPFWLYVSGSASVLVALFMLFFSKEDSGRQSSIVDRRSSIVGSWENHSSIGSANEVEFIGRHSQSANEINHTRGLRIHPAEIEANLSKPLIDEVSMPRTIDYRPSTIDKSIDNSTNNSRTPLPSINEKKSAENSAESIHMATSAISDNNKPGNLRYSFFISAGLPPVQSTLHFSDLLYGSVGMHLNFNSASSLVVELRRNAFVQKSTVQKASYRDTVLTVGNQTFHNVIGQFSSVSEESPNSFFSLGAGYRFTFMESGLFAPFGEVLLGASAHGGLTSEIAGIRYSFGSPFSFEFGVRGDQLFSHGSSPQTAFNFNGKVVFSW